jgi:putative heme iron utilization protein
MMTLKMRVGLATLVMRVTMNKEYLEAKAKLCLDQAEIDIQQQEIARAIKNLERANSALSRIFNLEEGENE